MKPKAKRMKTLRAIIQWTMFMLVAGLALVKFLKEQGVVIPFPEISLHTVCPFGGVVTLYQFFTTGDLVPKLHSSALVLMFLGMVVAFFFGPLFCGYFCPPGTWQEWLGKLGRKLLGRKYSKLIPPSVDRWLHLLRYVVLAVVVWLTATSIKLVFAEVDPFYALFNFYTGEAAWTAIAVLAVVSLLSVVMERPWCRYLCPYGAVLGIFNKVRLFPVRRRESTCIHCGKCDRACPMGIEVSAGTAVRDTRCITCHECLSGAACPVEDTVVISAQKEGVAP